MQTFRWLRCYLHAPVRRDEAEIWDRNFINLFLRGVRNGGALTTKAFMTPSVLSRGCHHTWLDNRRE